MTRMLQILELTALARRFRFRLSRRRRSGRCRPTGRSATRTLNARPVGAREVSVQVHRAALWDTGEPCVNNCFRLFLIQLSTWVETLEPCDVSGPGV